jgi:hypothetical protein
MIGCGSNKNLVDSAVYDHTARMPEAIDETILSVKPKKSSFPDWYLTYIQQ